MQPPLTPFCAEGIFKGEGGGGYIFEAPLRQEFYTPPLAPPPRRVCSGGGVKFGLVIR